jgi:hypothetical protein
MMAVNSSKPQQLFNIHNFNIPDTVRRRAMELYSRMRVDIKKGTKRKELEYFLVYSAYKEEGMVVEPHCLAKIMGIDPSSIAKAHSAFSFSSTGYKPPILIGSPIKLIPELCAKMGTIEVSVVENIVCLARSVLVKNSSLLEHSPQKLAVAFIEAYLEKNSYEVDKQMLCELVNVTDGTLNTVIKVIKNST